jgi:hypothetical protein
MELLPFEEGSFEGSLESSSSVGAAASTSISGIAVGSFVTVSNGGMVIVGCEVDADVRDSFVVGIEVCPPTLLREGRCEGSEEVLSVGLALKASEAGISD